MYFKDVVGLSDTKKHLIESVQRGIIPHARLIHGPEGVGKLPLAIAYARYLNCENRQPTDSCGQCRSCQKFDKFAHPDLHFVFPVVKSKMSDEYLPQWRQFLSKNQYFNLNDWLDFIGAENAQALIYSKESDEIIRKLNLKVYEAPYKIMLVWLPEKMHAVCGNKLLKLIEEPPASTIFLLISEDLENVLGTIQSRCQPLPIHAVSNNDLTDALIANFGTSADEAASFVNIASGSYLKAMKLAKSAGESAVYLDMFKEMMRASVSRNITHIKSVATQLATIGRETQKDYLQYCLRLFREYFIYNLRQPEMVYLNKDEAEFGIKFSPYINEKNVEALNNEFSLAYRQIGQNGNAKIIFLDLCLKVTVWLKKTNS